MNGPLGNDPAFFPSQIQDRRALDDESFLRKPDLQRRMVEIQSRPMFDKRPQRLKKLPTEARDVHTYAQGDPVEVDRRSETPFLLINVVVHAELITQDVRACGSGSATAPSWASSASISSSD
jgi:hypothetical protein